MGVEHLPGQRVAEGIAIVGRDQQARGDGPARRGQQALLRQRNGRGQQFMGHPAIRDADLVDDRPGLHGEPCGLGQHGIGDRGGQRLRAGIGEFPGVQRVAACGADHRRDPVRAGGVGREQARYKFGDLAVG